MDEAGLPGFYVSIWFGLWAPKDTPKDISTKVNAATVAALADPVVKEKLGKLGQQVSSADQQTPAVLGALQKAEADRFQKNVSAIGDPEAYADYIFATKLPEDLKIQLRYAGLRTIRFCWETRPDLVSKKDLVAGLYQLLDQSDVADFAIEDLRKWKVWEATDRVLDLAK